MIFNKTLSIVFNPIMMIPDKRLAETNYRANLIAITE